MLTELMEKTVKKYKTRPFIITLLSPMLTATSTLSMEQHIPPLHQEVIKGDIRALQELIRQDPTAVNATNQYRQSALHLAACLQNLEAIKMLTATGAPPNTRDACGSTPLGYAICSSSNPEGGCSRADVVCALLEAGANIHNTCGFYGPPLHTALTSSTNEVVRALIRLGADITSRRNQDGATPLHIISVSLDAARVRSLLEAGADTELCDNDGDTPLQLWVKEPQQYDNLRGIRTLLEHGASMIPENRE